MNNIGIGIFCFSDIKYFYLTKDKIKNICSNDTHCYILTDNIDWFNKNIPHNNFLHLINYHRTTKSYHDKIILHKHILSIHDISIVLDADCSIIDETFLFNLKNHNLKDGISYIETLETNKWNKKLIGEIDTSTVKWSSYFEYIESLCPEYKSLETIWEYLILINGKDLNKDFFKIYEKLQIVKEYADLKSGYRELLGAGEGITTKIAAKISNTNCEKDFLLYDLLKDKIKPVQSRQ